MLSEHDENIIVTLIKETRDDVKDMRAELKELSEKSVTVDHCKECQSNFVDRREFQGAIKWGGSLVLLTAIAGKANEILSWIESWFTTN